MKSKKKYIIFGIILFICLTILFFTVIKKLDKEEILFPDYEHYQLDDKKGLYYDFIDGEELMAYKIIKTGECESGEVDSLYYKINPKIDDYILLDELPPEKSENLLDAAYTLFYKDKLYLLRGWQSAKSIYEYTLDKEKIIKKEIDIDIAKDLHSYISRINKIENDFIFLTLYNLSTNSTYKIKCSLNNYTCDKIE